MNLRGLTMEQLDIVSGYMHGMKLRAGIDAHTGDVECPAGVTPEQHESFREQTRAAYAARVEALVSSNGAYADGVRAAMSRPSLPE